jgi:7,8-dihydropterin-6-yl-methyl-4-(beta-D-ribofuranosyl)aminobenzene 5'-phosphate synthase
MAALAPVDRLEVLILVDNVTDNLSSAPSFVEPEMGRLWRRGLRLWSGNSISYAAHGLSCLLTAYRGDQTHTMLFDTGPDEAVFQRNVERLGVEMGRIEAMMLSHGHWDHGGGMLRALDLISLGNGGRDVPTYMHPGMFGSRALKFPDGTMRTFADIATVHELTQHGADVVSTTEPQTILDDMFHVSGEIPRVTSYERGMPGQHRQSEDGQSWKPDPLVLDERFLAVNAKDKGLVVFTACSHAGVVNVMTHGIRFPVHRSTPCWAASTSSDRTRRSSRTRSKVCAASASRPSSPAIARAGAPSTRLLRPSARRSCPARSASSSTSEDGFEWRDRQGGGLSTRQAFPACARRCLASSIRPRASRP